MAFQEMIFLLHGRMTTLEVGSVFGIFAREVAGMVGRPQGNDCYRANLGKVVL